MKYWSKSALYIYRYLEQMTNTIDKIVLSTGKNSNHQNIQRYQTTMYQTRKIIELIDRKRKMINLKVAVEDSLQKLPRMERKVLMLVFIDGVKSESIAEIMGISLRTFFRKKAKGLECFKEKMIENGYNIEFFENEYYNEKWMMSVYNESIQKYNKEDECLNIHFINRMMKEVSDINFSCVTAN